MNTIVPVKKELMLAALELLLQTGHGKPFSFDYITTFLEAFESLIEWALLFHALGYFPLVIKCVLVVPSEL